MLKGIMLMPCFLTITLFFFKVFKFVFNKVDMQSPDNEYSFSIKLALYVERAEW